MRMAALASTRARERTRALRGRGGRQRRGSPPTRRAAVVFWSASYDDFHAAVGLLPAAAAAAVGIGAAAATCRRGMVARRSRVRWVRDVWYIPRCFAGLDSRREFASFSRTW